MTEEFSDVSYADSIMRKRDGTSPLMPFSLYSNSLDHKGEK